MVIPPREGSEGRGYLFEKTPPGKLFTDFNEIVRFDEEFWDITKGLPIRTGSLMRLGQDSFKRWRIALTEENREKIREKADEFRAKDYREREGDCSIENVEMTTVRVLMRNSIIRAMVHMVSEVMSAIDDGSREFRICDLASGSGKTSLSLAASLYSDLSAGGMLQRTSFHLVDYNEGKLRRAKEKLEQYPVSSVEVTAGRDDDFLKTTDKRFDFVLSICHLHKKPFVVDTLKNINHALARKGVLVSADWHSSLSDHPLFIYQLFERMGVDPWRLSLFRSMFGGFMNPPSNPSLNQDEIRAVSDHQEYWAGVYQEILASPSAMMRDKRHYVLGGFDTTAKRLGYMDEAELVTDPARIRRAFPEVRIGQNPINMVTGSDRASVIMAMKGRAGR